MRQSYTYPELSITEDAKVYLTKSKKQINLQFDHGYCYRGPIVAFTNLNGTYRTIPVAKLIFECFVVCRKYRKNDYWEFIDGDENNCNASNIVQSDIKNKYKKKKLYLKESDNEISTWMNGDSEIYI